MNYLKNLKEQFTFDQLLLIFTCFSFTFPFYILGPILLIEFIYLLVSKKAIITLKQTPQIKFLYLFVFHKYVLYHLNNLLTYIAFFLLLNYKKRYMIMERITPMILAMVIFIDRPNVMTITPRFRTIGSSIPKDCP